MGQKKPERLGQVAHQHSLKRLDSPSVWLPIKVAHLWLKCSINVLARQSMAAVAVHQRTTHNGWLQQHFSVYLYIWICLCLRSTSNGLELTFGSVDCISLLAVWHQWSTWLVMKSTQMSDRDFTGFLSICGILLFPMLTLVDICCVHWAEWGIVDENNITKSTTVRLFSLSLSSR